MHQVKPATSWVCGCALFSNTIEMCVEELNAGHKTDLQENTGLHVPIYTSHGHVAYL